MLLVWGRTGKYLAAMAVLTVTAMLPFMHRAAVTPDWSLSWADAQAASVNTGGPNVSEQISQDRFSKLLKDVKLFCNDAFTRADGSRDDRFILMLVANVSALLMGVLFFCWGGVKNLLSGFWKKTASAKDKIVRRGRHISSTLGDKYAASDKKRRASKLIGLRTIIASIVTVGILTTTVLAGTEQHDAKPGAKPQSAAKERLITAEAAVGKKVGSYTLIDQDGKQFQLADLGGKPYVINFVYTNCSHACPLLTSNLATAVKGAKKELGVKFRMMTVGFDTEHDTPGAMKQFGSRFVERFDGWTFATADRATMDALTSNFGFYYQKEESGGFAHMNMVSLVDSKGVIKRHVYGMELNKKELLGELKRIW